MLKSLRSLYNSMLFVFDMMLDIGMMIDIGPKVTDISVQKFCVKFISFAYFSYPLQ